MADDTTPSLHYVTLGQEITHLRFLLQESEQRDSGRQNTQTITDQEILDTIKRALWSTIHTSPTAFDFADAEADGTRSYADIAREVDCLTLDDKGAKLPIQSSRLLDFEKLTLLWINLRNSPEVRPSFFQAPTEVVSRPIQEDSSAYRSR